MGNCFGSAAPKRIPQGRTTGYREGPPPGQLPEASSPTYSSIQPKNSARKVAFYMFLVRKHSSQVTLKTILMGILLSCCGGTKEAKGYQNWGSGAAGGGVQTETDRDARAIAAERVSVKGLVVSATSHEMGRCAIE
jgi:hypothetical protein